MFLCSIILLEEEIYEFGIILFLVLKIRLKRDRSLRANPYQFSLFSEGERMLEGKALVQDTDMPGKMQIQAMDAASKALDLYDVFDCKSIAAHIKKVLSLSLSLLV